MKNKIIKIFLITSLFLVNICPIFALQELDSNVKNIITEIYDSRQQYLDLVGDFEESESNYKYVNSNTYWWPIGSVETTEVNGVIFAKDDPETTNITSNYGNREDPFGRGTTFHGGIDISGGRGEGQVNVIASKDGVVVYPTDGVLNNCPSSSSLSDCGGGYGNYVIIQHSDGKYTLYAHMYENSITVKAGDTVSQGQVIGKIGSSGNSTGAHLHFEVRVENSSKGRVNPLDYVDPNSPRTIAALESTDSFSLIKSSLTRNEFINKMNDYCTRSKGNDFCSVFAANAGKIYDISHENNVNPELVVVTAGKEQGFKNCGTSNNYWGIGIYNGKGCSSGPQYSSVFDGIVGYAKTLSKYQPGGSMAAWIEKVYYERLEAGADPNGIGLPGTFAGMQMVYSSLGKHVYGGSGTGGYYYMDPARAGVTTIYSTHEEFLNKCKNAGGVHASGTSVTVWEQSRYTIYQMQGKVKLRNAIFGI